MRTKLEYIKEVVSAGLVILVWLMGVLPTLIFFVIPRLNSNDMSFALAALYIALLLITIYCYKKAVYSDPGFVSHKSLSDYMRNFKTSNRPECSECTHCQEAKPARAHHCRRCGRCVLVMDHHCMWILNCVGEANRWIFLQLVLYTMLLSGVGLLIGLLDTWHWPECNVARSCKFDWLQDRDLWPQLATRIKIRRALIVMAILVFIASLLLNLQQALNIALGKTTIERMMEDREYAKTGKRPQPNPEDSNSSFTNNLEVICGYRSAFPQILFPCRHREKFLVNDRILYLSQLDV